MLLEVALRFDFVRKVKFTLVPIEHFLKQSSTIIHSNIFIASRVND